MRSTPLHSVLVGLAIVLALALLWVVLGDAFGLFTEGEAERSDKSPAFSLMGEAPELDQTVALSCDAKQLKCSAEHNGFSLTLTLSPNTLPALTPVRFKLHASTQNTHGTFEALSAQISGRDMFMGVHPLSQLDDGLSGTAIFEGLIPVCVTGQDMVWRVEFLAEVQHENTQEVWLVYADLKSLNDH